MTREAAAGPATPFDLLHPAVQHHVVNSLGWRSLRSHQEEAIAPILRGDHVLVQAPTAGGKTEAALLPVLSRMLADNWAGPSVLYLSPIKALLNDLEVRIRRLAGHVGRTVGLWHGDVAQPARRRLQREPPDILLSTPESVEVMLVSRLVDHAKLFTPLRCVIVDEIHAFAGDDRGWHLLALVERLGLLAEKPIQRIALSATLANAEELLQWLTAGADHARTVVRGSGSMSTDADVQVDFVSSVQNATLILSRLHLGQKRLVFCDSRTQVEELAQGLRAHGVRTFVSHSSLGVDERRQAEAAFAQGSDCVIVATSTLELGIDVGDLDRVVQIDAPRTVAGFLQRLGRTGRRAGARRNCLFLATNDDSLLRATGLVRLWQDGFVEPVTPPTLPYHVLAQQMMASILQDSGIDRTSLIERLHPVAETDAISREDLQVLLTYMLEQGILYLDGSVLGMGSHGEFRYGSRHYLQLFSVFDSPPLFVVRHGNTEIGQVHELTFRRRSEDEPLHIALGGKGWRVTHLDWERHQAWVEPAEVHGKSRWLGEGAPQHYELAQAVRGVLLDGAPEETLSRRARERLDELRRDYAWMSEDATTLLVNKATGRCRWWTFAGDRYNVAMKRLLRAGGIGCQADALGLSFTIDDAESQGGQRLVQAIDTARSAVVDGWDPPESNELVDELKFAECVPLEFLSRMALKRFSPGRERAIVGQLPISVRFQLSKLGL